MRLLLIAGAISSLCMAAAAEADILAVKVRLSIGEDGQLAGTAFPDLSAKEAASVAAGYAAYGMDATPDQAVEDVQNYSKAYSPEDARSGAEHRGIYRSPEGWHVCKAKIDLAHAGIDSGLAFSASIEWGQKGDDCPDKDAASKADGIYPPARYP